MTYAHDLRPGGPRTLVMLHGTGGDRVSFGALAPRIDPEAGVLSLDGDVLEGPHKRFFRRRAEGLYDMADLAARTGALAAFLEDAAARHGLDPAGMMGVGYSNGANILANLALTGQGPLRRLVLMHPLIPFDPAPPDLDGWAVLVTAGRRDPICPPELTERLVRHLERAGAAVALHWTDGGHELAADEVAAARGFAP